MPLAEVTTLTRHHRNSPNRHRGSATDPNTNFASDSIATSRSANHWQLTLEAHDSQTDLQILQQLAQWCEQFSPIVGLDPAQSPTGLLLDVTGIGHLFGGDQALAERVVLSLRGQGYWPRVAIASTVGAAWGLAHYGREPSSTISPHRDADINNGSSSNDANAPIALPTPQVVSTRKTSEAIAPLSIAALRISQTSIELLHRLGVDRIEQLLTLPRDELAARLGDEVTTRLDQALGNSDEIILAHQPPTDFQTEWALEHPTDQQQVLLQAIKHLTHHLAHLLQAQNQGALQINCTFHMGAKFITITAGLFRPTAVADHLFQLLSMQLESCQLPGSVSKIVLAAIHTARLIYEQQALWQDDNHEQPHVLAELIDRLSSRLGPATILAARLRSSALPEEGYALIPLTGPGASLARLNSAAGKRAPFQAGHRPLQLLHPPQPLNVVSVTPNGPPTYFDHAGKRQQVGRHWGPERIETAWWQGSCIRRDYYRVECESGCRFWIFRQLNDQSWHLHGRF